MMSMNKTFVQTIYYYNVEICDIYASGEPVSRLPSMNQAKRVGSTPALRFVTPILKEKQHHLT